MEPRVTDNAAAQRYELWLGDDLAGWIDYRVAGSTVALTHAEVREELRGQGLAETMTRETLADLKSRGLEARPVCPYVVAYARRHPDEL